MANYAQHFSTRQTPQTEQADPRQVPNSGGGYTFTLDKWKRLDRWLILGAEGGTYYASERKLTIENAKTVQECLDEDGPRTVKTIVEVSDAGRAPKNDPAVFALAIAAGHKDPATRKAALTALSKVCRIGTHLFQFCEMVGAFRGWGRGLHNAIGAWYNEKSPEQLAYQVAKYGSRNSWSHRDLLRKVRPTATADKAAIFRWIVAGQELGDRTVKRGATSATYPSVGELPAFLSAFDELKKTTDVGRVAQLIREHGFTHEMVPTEAKNSKEVWEALLEKMPMTALIRNLGKMTNIGLLGQMSAASSLAAGKLTDPVAIKKARIHPIAVLIALKTYSRGHGDKGKLSWTPVPKITDALDSAFYQAFDAVEPTGKSHMICLDVSGSMSGGYGGAGILSPREITAAMAMTVVRTEPNHIVTAFSNTFVGLNISAKQRLDDVIRIASGLPFSNTDCALPFLAATAEKWLIDTFSVWTDNETNSNSMHPHQALRQYRERSGVAAKLAVCATTATNFTIADPSDAGMLDLVGFDASIPNVLADFERS